MVIRRMAKHKTQFVVAVVFSMVFLSGCAAVGLTLFGVAAGTATGTSVAYTLDGVAYRTFTAPLAQVERATLMALNDMGIEVDGAEKTNEGKAIKAKGVDRQIEIELEAVSSKTTRIRTVAKQGVFFKDRATATEIILQTERILGKA